MILRKLFFVHTPFRSAIQNAYYHYQAQSFCGKCLPYTAPTQKATTNKNEESSRTGLAVKPTKRIATTVEKLDGPYININLE